VLGTLPAGTTERTWEVEAPRELTIEGDGRIEWLELI
jgi:hypothetical protein